MKRAQVKPTTIVIIVILVVIAIAIIIIAINSSNNSATTGNVVKTTSNREYPIIQVNKLDCVYQASANRYYLNFKFRNQGKITSEPNDIIYFVVNDLGLEQSKQAGSLVDYTGSEWYIKNTAKISMDYEFRYQKNEDDKSVYRVIYKGNTADCGNPMPKQCNYYIGNEQVNIYNCESQMDCINKVSDLISTYQVSSSQVTVIGCM